MRKLMLTQYALGNIREISEHSIVQWGQATAEKYLTAIEFGLLRLQEQPNLLREEPDLHLSLTFYRVNKHLLVCDVQATLIIVLTVIHASMDIPTRLAELEPKLSAEVGLLHNRLGAR